MKSVPDQIARFVPQPFIPLGTDGYGYSDTRAALRRHFEIDAAHIVVAVSTVSPRSVTSRARWWPRRSGRYEIDSEAPDPRTT